MQLSAIRQSNGYYALPEPAAQWERSTLTNRYSRPLNVVEFSARMQKLNEKLQDQIEVVYARLAKQYLKFYRELLEYYDTSRHIITMRAGNGCVWVEVDGDSVDDKPCRGIYTLLQNMHEAADDNWAVYVDGERLN